jgi:hypothetical protein
MKRYYIIAELLEMLQILEDTEKKALAIIVKFAFLKGKKIDPIIDGEMRGKFKKSDALLNVALKNAEQEEMKDTTIQYKIHWLKRRRGHTDSRDGGNIKFQIPPTFSGKSEEDATDWMECCSF